MTPVIITIAISTLTLLASVLGAIWRFALAFSRMETAIANLTSNMTDLKSKLESVDEDVRVTQTHISAINAVINHDGASMNGSARFRGQP